MSVRIARLRNGEDIICDLYEVTTQDDPDKAVGFQLKYPYSVWVSIPYQKENDDVIYGSEEEVTTKITEPTIQFEPWMPLAKNKTIMLRMDEVVSIYETHDQVLEKYNQLVEVECGRESDQTGASQAEE